VTALEQAAVISGIGLSEVGRRLNRDPWALMAEAALDAIEDAGLDRADVDGVSTYPGPSWSTPGITGGGVDDMRALLGLSLRWYAGGGETPGQLGSVVTAAAAVAAGLATHVLCFRCVHESSVQAQAGGRASVMDQSQANGDDQDKNGDEGEDRGKNRDVQVASEQRQWTAPYGVGYPCFGGLALQRYMHDSGATRNQIAQIAVVARANAAANPHAVYRTPLGVDDYLAARIVSDPLCIYDCDVPVDGAVAFVVSRASSSAVDRSRCVSFEAVGTASGFDEAADMMWSRTDLGPSDVGVAQLYDGFSVYALRWLEALGFCGRNEGAAFVEGGHRIARGGELPINTGGGQLSAGRLHGYGGLYEACLQLRGRAGDRQVHPAPEVAVATSGAEHFTSSLLLGAPR
jgi:acetyl-CoA acetyltransferase